LRQEGPVQARAGPLDPSPSVVLACDPKEPRPKRVRKLQRLPLEAVLVQARGSQGARQVQALHQLRLVAAPVAWLVATLVVVPVAWLVATLVVVPVVWLVATLVVVLVALRAAATLVVVPVAWLVATLVVVPVVWLVATQVGRAAATPLRPLTMQRSFSLLPRTVVVMRLLLPSQRRVVAAMATVVVMDMGTAVPMDSGVAE
jgi:hypothetical protein